MQCKYEPHTPPLGGAPPSLRTTDLELEMNSSRDDLMLILIVGRLRLLRHNYRWQ